MAFAFVMKWSKKRKGFGYQLQEICFGRKPELHASLIKLFVHCSNRNEIFGSKDKEIYFYKVIQA